VSAIRGKRPVVFGEVLFDRFPDGNEVLGGAPYNVAWHLQAFGQAPLFVSRVGDDDLGRRIREAMTAWRMDTSGLQLDSVHPTGTVEVSFRDGDPSYDIVQDCAYDFVEAGALPSLPEIALIYHGSLALRGAVARQAFFELSSRTGAPRFLDVNLRPPWWRRDSVLEMIGGATWIKLNEHELDLLASPGIDKDRASGAMRKEFGLDIVILTRGDQGAELHAADARLKVTPETTEQVVDTVGAGDAFTSVVLLGLLNNWSMKTTMERAQSFASAVVGIRGATVEDADFYSKFRAEWGLLKG